MLDYTSEVRMVLEAVRETGQRFGAVVISNWLTGKVLFKFETRIVRLTYFLFEKNAHLLAKS